MPLPRRWIRIKRPRMTIPGLTRPVRVASVKLKPRSVTAHWLLHDWASAKSKTR